VADSRHGTSTPDADEAFLTLLWPPESNDLLSNCRLSDMEDADATELSLDKGVENSNAFFAVYDGHGGTVQ
jgi:hypothetical protein